ncbi:hypothetical protein D3C79_295230 [compost metagenome]
MRSILLSIISIFTSLCLSAQNHCIYIHTDKDYYLPSDTVWFKAYLLEDGRPATTVFNLYMRIANEAGIEFQQSVAMVTEGISASFFIIPSQFKGNNIYINAYARNQHSPVQKPYFKKIGVLHFDEEQKSASRSPKSKQAFLHISPSGGILLNGIENQVAFQAIDQFGLPFMTKAKLLDDQNKQITTFETDSAGLAEVSFVPSTSAHYRVEWLDPKGDLRKNNLPQAVLGIKAHIIADTNLTSIQLQSNTAPKTVNVKASIGQRLLFSENIEVSSAKKINIPIQNSDLEYGIMQVQISDSQGKMLSKQSQLIGQNTIEITPQVSIEQGTGSKSANTLSLTLPHTIERASLSISITDIDIPIDSSSNIITDLIFKPITAYEIPSALKIWQSTKHKDLFIQSQSWLSEVCPTDSVIQPDTLIVLRGQISMQASAWPKFYKRYLKYNQRKFKESGKRRGISFGYKDFQKLRFKYTEAEMDSLGRFTVPNLIVFDSMDMRVSQIHSQLKFYPFKVNYSFVDPNKYRTPFYIPISKSGQKPGYSEPQERTNFKSYFYTDAKGNRILPTANVKRLTKRQREISLLERRFKLQDIPTNLDPDQILLPLLDEEVQKRAMSLYDYLRRHLNGYNYVTYLNGQRKRDPDRDFLMADVSNYAYIKCYRSFPPANGAAAVLIFELAPSEKDRDFGKYLDEQTTFGYMPIKQFTQRDYSDDTNKGKILEDNRMTLYWDPFVSIDSTAASKQIKFFNNSKAKGFCITIQGVCNTGQLVYYRRIFNSPESERPEN